MEKYNWTTPIKRLKEDGFISSWLEFGFANYGISNIQELYEKKNDLPTYLKHQATLLYNFIKVIISIKSHSSDATILFEQVEKSLAAALTYACRNIEEQQENQKLIYKVFGKTENILLFLIRDREIALSTNYIDLTHNEYIMYRSIMIYITITLYHFCLCFPENKYYAIFFFNILKSSSTSSEEIQTIINEFNSSTKESTNTDTMPYGIEALYRSLIKQTSFRTREILKYNEIQNYKDFKSWVKDKTSSFRILKHCGTKSALELDSIRQKLYDEDIRNKNTEEHITKKEFLGEHNNINTLSKIIDGMNDRMAYRNIISIFNSTNNFATEILENPNNVYLKITSIGITAYNEVILPLISQIATAILSNEDIKAVKPIEFPLFVFAKLYNKDKQHVLFSQLYSENKLKMLNTEFHSLSHSLSIRCLNALRHIVNPDDKESIIDFVLNKHDFFSYNRVGRKTAIEMQTFLDEYSKSFASILFSDEISIKSYIIKRRFPFIEYNRIQFVNDFYSKHNHLPMLLLSQEFFEHNQTIASHIYADYYEIGYTKQLNLEELSLKYRITKERIRQIVTAPNDWIVKEHTTLFSRDDWHNYPLLYQNVLTEQNINLQQYNQDENTFLSFKAICGIIKLLNPIIIEKFTLRDGSQKVIGYSSLIKNYNINLSIRELNRIKDRKKTFDLVVPLYEFFINDEKYWRNNASADNIQKKMAYSLLTEVIKMLELGPIDENGIIIFCANKIDYSQTIYDIIKSNGKPMHINDIFNIFIHKFPHDPHTTPDSLRSFILKDNRIDCIGRKSIYTLTSWDLFSGSISQLLIDLLTNHLEPVRISELSMEALEYRNDSSLKSISSCIWQMVNDGLFRMYYPDFVGLKEKSYDKKYKYIPRNFKEYLDAFVNFVLDNKRYPLLQNQGYESMLCRWHTKAKQFIKLSEEEIVLFSNAMQSLEGKRYPHDIKEYNFLKNCKQYKEFVCETGRFINEEDDKTMCNWFWRSVDKFKAWNDNRKAYFIDLINFISHDIGKDTDDKI